MGMRTDKVRIEFQNLADEVRANVQELFVDNVPRLKNPKEWHHLFVDPFVSAFSILKALIMPYTLGHLAAFAVVGAIINGLIG